MIKITFKEPENDPVWDSWRERCEKETENLKKAHVRGEKISIKDHLYKDKRVKKKYYFNDSAKAPFYRKCSYCECKIEAQGDIEHYRPKKGVADFNGSIDNHPGYFWLAYEWKNLFPSCMDCNRLYNWEKDDGVKVVGKKNLFPLKSNSPRAFSPTDNLNLEKPLIINPFEDDPEKHLYLDMSNGFMFWKTDKGEATVKIFGMNVRDKIRDGRKERVRNTRSHLDDYHRAIQDQNNDEIQKQLEILLDLIKGSKSYTFASRYFLKEAIGEDYEERIKRKLVEVTTNS